MNFKLILMTLLVFPYCAKANQILPDETKNELTVIKIKPVSSDPVTVKSEIEIPDSVEIEFFWEFYLALKEPTISELADGANFKFGQEAGCLYNLFMTIYVVREEVVSGDPTRRTVIRKPALYNAVRTVEKELSKELKNGKTTPDEAAKQFIQILKTAIAAFDSDSESFEQSLYDSRKDINQIKTLFYRVNIREI